MKQLLILLCGLVGNTAINAQQVVGAEYFIDTDQGPGNNTQVTLPTPQADGSYQLQVSLSGLPPGYHKLYVRTRDNEGNWSLTSRRNIEVIATAGSKTVVGGEYFFDSDPGIGAGATVTINAKNEIILQNFTASSSGLTPGYHKLYFRFKDNDGTWSITARRNIEVAGNELYVIAGAEYFFNVDPGVGHANPVIFDVPQAMGSFQFKIPVGSIPTGAHTLYIRARDSVHQRWSLTQWEKDSVVTSVQNGNWSQPATWSNNKVPTAGTVVLLYHVVNVDINAVCKSLTPYGTNATCTIQAGKLLDIKGH